MSVNSINVITPPQASTQNIPKTSQKMRHVNSKMVELPETFLGKDLIKPVEIIKAGNEILETAFNAETKPGKATFILANGTEIAPTKFLFAPVGTMVETLESQNGAASRATIGEFQYIQIDAQGNPCVKDIQDLTKKLRPVDFDSNNVFARVQDLITKRKNVMDIEPELMAKSLKDKVLSQLWEDALPKLMKAL